MAAAELVGVAWRGEEGSSARGSGSRRSLGCRVGRWGSRSWPAALLGGGRCRSAPAAEEAEKERGGRHKLDLFAISEKFRGPTVVAKMASHAIFQYNVLAIDDTHNTWTNVIVKMTILRLLGSSDDKEKIGVARPEGPPLRKTEIL